jgi:glycosyltransferase involved in cell wall biosynthesis
MKQRMVALLGRRDEPTDAVEEYCRYLSEALGRRFEITLDMERVGWAESGWASALLELRARAARWKSEWVFVQYTALAWSKRGFPSRFLQVVKVLREAEARVAVVFHDVEPYGGARLIDKLRRSSQLNTMRSSLNKMELAIFTVPMHTIRWLRGGPSHARFIPVGANLVPPTDSGRSARQSPPRVAVFGITGGSAGEEECELIAETMKAAAGRTGRTALHVFGRGVLEREKELRKKVSGPTVDLQIEGILPAEGVAKALSGSDVLLFVREPISSRRGSAIAGISCGLPVVCYRGAHTTAPITEAGVVAIPKEMRHELTRALARVLSDDDYREELATLSRKAYQEHFSWDAIAKKYVEVTTDRA